MRGRVRASLGGRVLQVARAHKERGFPGVGGKEVSPEEQAALDEIDAVLS